MKRFRKSSILAKSLCAAGALACLDAASAAGQELIVGATTHFYQGKGILAENLSLAKQAGISSIRDEGSWGRCEKVKGSIEIPQHVSDYVNLATGSGFAPLFTLDYANRNYDGGDYPRSAEAIEGFTRYSEAIVAAFKGKVKLYQVWNEWDGGCGMEPQFKGKGDLESYVKLLSATYPRIKAIDPSITVLAGSICKGDDYLEKTLKLGVLKHCDAISLHTYNYSRGPASTPEAWLERMQGVDKMLRSYNGGKEVPLYVSEMGWPTHISSSGRTQAESADCLVRLYLLAKTLPYIKGVYWYDFQDDGWDAKDRENNFGMLRPDLTPKKQYFALKDIAPLIAHSTFEGRIDAGDPNIWVLKFKESDGKATLAIWSSYLDDDYQITLKGEGKSLGSAIELLRPGEGRVSRTFGARDWVGSKNAPFAADEFQLAFRGSPYLLKGDLDNVKIARVEKREFQEKSRPKNAARAPEGIAIAKRIDAKEAAKPQDFGAESCYRKIAGEGRGGKRDLDASFSASWDKSKLRLSVAVEDDVFSQGFEGDATWKGDGLQLALQPVKRNGANASFHLDIDAAIAKDGPSVYRQSPEPGPAKDISAKISRNGTKTFYEIEIPAKSLGLSSLKAESIIGCSILANDNDGNGRKGYLHWGDGIGDGKDPSAYNWIILED